MDLSTTSSCQMFTVVTSILRFCSIFIVFLLVLSVYVFWKSHSFAMCILSYEIGVESLVDILPLNS